MNGMPSYSKVVSFPSSSTSSLNWGKQENLNFSCGALSLVVQKVIYSKIAGNNVCLYYGNQ